MGLSMTERKAVTKELARRYQKASKSEKGKILSELCALTGWSRRHARRAIDAVGSIEPPKRRCPPPRIYDEPVLEALRRIWRLAGGPCGKRLAPFLGEFVQALERHGEIDLAPQVRAKLERMSAATIDRVLASERKRLQVRGRHGTKPGTMLKHQIPIRTFAEWDDAQPGFCEVDLVGHDGGSTAGDYAQTLDLTDVRSGWTDMQAVLNKAQIHVHAALKDITQRLPFPLLGLDSDNGSEFINDELHRWCADNKITFTRTRPYRKNDNCFVEQKNWTHVRQQVGYARYEGPRAVALLNELYASLRLWVNFFAPQQRLISKTRNGARVTRRYDTAATPYQRLLASPSVSPAAKAKLRRHYHALNPAALSRQIGQVQRRLIRLAAQRSQSSKTIPAGIQASPAADPQGGQRPTSATRPKEVKPSPDHPWRKTFSRREQVLLSRTSSVRQRKAPTRTS